MDQTEYQQALAAGEEVARVINSPVFNRAWAETIQSYADELISAPPAHDKERASLAAEARAGKRFMQRLMAYYQRAEAAVAHQQAQQPVNSVDEYQGFATPGERA